MPVVDMPLSELETYLGKSPCPDDFDLFWKRGLQQTAGTDPCVRLETADFACSFADCFDMYFTGVNSSQIHAKFLKPKYLKSGKCPAVLHFHGYAATPVHWVELLPYAAQGYIVAAMDCRGQNGNSQDTTLTEGPTFHGHLVRGLSDRPENLIFRQIFLDTAMLAGIIMDMSEVDDEEIYTIGKSQGGALALACAAFVPAVKKTAVAYPFLSDYKRIWELDVCTAAYIEIRNYFRQNDPMHQQEDQIFNCLGYIDVQNMAKWIKAKTLMAITLRDDVCPPSTQFAIYNRLTCQKKLMLYPDYSHEMLPYFWDSAFCWFTEM